MCEERHACTHVGKSLGGRAVKRENRREREFICVSCPREAGNRTRLMFYDRQKPATLFNVAPIRALSVLASHSSIL